MGSSKSIFHQGNKRNLAITLSPTYKESLVLIYIGNGTHSYFSVFLFLINRFFEKKKVTNLPNKKLVIIKSRAFRANAESLI